MRQAGILAAGALYGLEKQMDRLEEDHQHAKLLADAIDQCEGLHLLDRIPDTNIVIFQLDRKLGTASEFAAKLKSFGILSLPFGPQCVRFVTHMDVSRSQIEAACNLIQACTSHALAS